METISETRNILQYPQLISYYIRIKRNKKIKHGLLHRTKAFIFKVRELHFALYLSVVPLA